MATTGHLFEEMMATYHPLGIAEEVDCTSPNTQWAFPTALEEMWRGNFTGMTSAVCT